MTIDSRRPRHTFPEKMAEANPGPVPVHKALPRLITHAEAPSVHATKRQAPNYGGRVPVDTTPGPVTVYRALKNPHSPCQSTAIAQPSQFSAL